eukprot:CAMPEP_0113627154 /NCGR_PEP_ID=MMETSP0017_2-20120614/14055_1 /TAXON_ID=2856 /ORGANISM="Cylindrotheca closterium" /LENGTH=281 /DNA_ID=CAMNT_0000537383 /DNA_START=13 /DNA_END=855 /DNA_ORIENTATION=- /assembly_acc=CAM_ASM_000147
MGMRRIDGSCFFAAVFFVLSGIFRTILFGRRHGSHSESNFSLMKAMDGDYLRTQWTDIDGLLHSLRIVQSIMHILAWVITATVLFRAAWLQSSRGTSSMGLHCSIAFLGSTVAIVELLVHMLMLGSMMALQWMASDFTMENWYEIDGLGSDQQDLIGWKVLEVVSISAHGMLLWVDTIEYFLLATLLILLFISTKGQASPLSTSWSCFGLFIAILCILDVASEVLRFTNWRLFSQVCFWISTANRCILFPNWLMWLGVQLAVAPTAMKQEIDIADMEDDPQ